MDIPTHACAHANFYVPQVVRVRTILWGTRGCARAGHEEPIFDQDN